MKYLLASNLWLSFCAVLSAQNPDFAPIGAKWYYSELNFALKIIPHVVESVSKENYQGKWCSKLVTSSYDIMPNPSYVYTENDTVYYFSPSTHQFEMLYDFTAGVGDSWVIGGLPAVIPDNPLPYASDTVTVDSISSVVVGNDTLKVWHVHNSFWFDWGERIFEKAGNDQLFMPKFALVEAYVWGLRCFDTPTEAYHFVPYPCDTSYFTLGAVGPMANPIQIFPNPASSVINFQIPDPVQGFWFLANPSGKRVQKGVWDGSSIQLNITDAVPGLYFFQIQANDGQMFTGKIAIDDRE